MACPYSNVKESSKAQQFFIIFNPVKKIGYLFATFFLFSCKKEENTNITNFENLSHSESKGNPSRSSVIINKKKNTVRERFSAPEDYEWIESETGSYGHFIEHFKLKKYGSPIVKFNGEKIGNQNLHEAVLDIDTGEKDLQQCADAVIRLRSEYLFKTKNFGDIKFHFTSGDLVTWNDYKNGMRAFVAGNSVNFRKTAEADDSYQNFRNYLNLIYNYAGTISQFKETKPIRHNDELQTGDILITAGSPGHVVFIAGVSKNKSGGKLYLLGEGFTPAQSVSIMKNPFNQKISPWYELDVNSPEIRTSRYIFKPVNFRRY